MKLKLNIISLIQSVFVWVLILNCRSVYTSLPNNSWFRNLLLVLLLLSTFFLLLFKKIPVKKLKSSLVSALMLFLYFLIYIRVTEGESKEALQVLLSLVMIYIFYTLYCDRNSLSLMIRTYVDFMSLIAVVSVVLWLLISCLKLVGPSNLVYSSWTNSDIRNYFYIYFEVQKGTSLMDLIGVSGYRNTAIFNEAPMFSFHLILAILFNEFIIKDDRKKSALLAIAVVTSFSSTGYIAILGILFLKYVVKKSSDNIRMFLKFVIVPLAVVVVGGIVVAILQNKLAAQSGIVRIDDIQAWISLWRDYPIFGAGYGTQEYIKYLSSWRNGTGVSNSFGMILGYGGIWMMIVYVIPVVRYIGYALGQKQLDMICFLIVFLFIFFVTVVPFQYITFFVFVGMNDGFALRDNKRYRKRIIRVKFRRQRI